jgi:Nickel responsive protein SCO4226-like
MREFIGEQYVPADDASAAAGRADAARAAADQLRCEGTRVEYVRSIFIPDDETCIHLYRADSIEAVRAAAARACLHLERIAEAIGDAGSSEEQRS